MTDSPSETPPGAPQRVNDAEVLVGHVNTSFDPLEPEAAASTTPTASAVSKHPLAADAVQQDENSPPLDVTPASSSQKLLGCLRDVLLVLISIILATAFTLSILLALNSTLFLNDREKTTYLEVALSALQSKQKALEKQAAQQGSALTNSEAQLQTLDQQVQALAAEQQMQANDLATLQARSNDLEQTVRTAGENIAAVQSQQEALEDNLVGLDEQLTTIQDNIAEFEETAARFDKFVQGMIALIADIAPEEVAPPQTAGPATPAAPSPSDSPVTTPAASEALTLTITPAITETSIAEQSTLERFPPTRPLPTPAHDRSVIYGLIWLDANENGVADAEETTLPGIRVLLQDNAGNALLNMITGVDGRFAFINMPAGAYQLQIILPKNSDLIAHKAKTVSVAVNESLEVNLGLTQP